MKLHWSRVAWGAAILAIPVYLLTSFNKPSFTPELPSVAPGPRAPASAPQNPCVQMHRTICQKRGETRDPTGAVKPDVAGEVQALRAYERIIRENPGWTSEQIDEELVQKIYTKKRRDRVQSAYHWVVRALEQFINRQPATVFNTDEKKQLIQRVRKTELQLPPPASIYADEPDLFTKNDVFYERTLEGKTRMRVGGAYLLTAKSWFNLVFTLAHELGHSIDPCELRAARLAFPAYDRISACFLGHGLIAARANRRECGQNDQLSETFADWVAVQIVGEALKNFATEFHGPQLVNAATNAVRDLCEQDGQGVTDSELEFHPSPETRIDGIFARNPVIREVLGCGTLIAANDPFPEYCGFDFVIRPLPQTSPQPSLLPPATPVVPLTPNEHL